MPRIFCTLPNASDNINGIKFTARNGGMMSGDVDDETAAHFASIPGYALADRAGKLIPGPAPADPLPGAQDPPPAAETAAQRLARLNAEAADKA